MTPIAQVVEPLRQEAIARAAQYAVELADRMTMNIEEHGWDLRAAPLLRWFHALHCSATEKT